MSRTIRKQITIFAVSLVILLICLGYLLIGVPWGDIGKYESYYIDDTGPPVNGAVKVTFLGTTSLLIDDGETQLMIDGFVSRPNKCAILTSNIQTNTAAFEPVIKMLDKEHFKGLFVAHSHYDHSFDVAYIIKQTKAKLYGSRSTHNVGYGGDLKKGQMELFEPGKELQFGKFTVTVLDAIHSSTRMPLKGTIDCPLSQPTGFTQYREGGSYDFLIKHGERTILIKPSANYCCKEGNPNNVPAEVVFLGTSGLGGRDEKFKNDYYDQNIAKDKTKLIIPMHWDDFTTPLSGHLAFPPWLIDDSPAAFEFLKCRIEKSNIEKSSEREDIRFGILQGYKSVLLFSGETQNKIPDNPNLPNCVYREGEKEAFKN
jgi:L-ascorbate metabolism protein UlaG (beta-lactamase superfamily)